MRNGIGQNGEESGDTMANTQAREEGSDKVWGKEWEIIIGY